MNTILYNFRTSLLANVLLDMHIHKEKHGLPSSSRSNTDSSYCLHLASHFRIHTLLFSPLLVSIQSKTAKSSFFYLSVLRMLPSILTDIIKIVNEQTHLKVLFKRSVWALASCPFDWAHSVSTAIASFCPYGKTKWNASCELIHRMQFKKTA